MQLSAFTIGLGLDSAGFEKGMKTAASSLDGFKSQILQLGATLASAFTFKALTFDFAEQNNSIAAMGKLIGATKDELYGLEEAGQAFGASAGAMTESLKSLALARSAFNSLGEIGPFGELAKLGVNIDAITGARTEIEAMYALSDELARLDSKRAAQAATMLGLSPEQLVLMRNGRQEMQRLSAEYADARKHTDEMATTSAEFIAQWNLLTANIGGRADALSVPLVNAINRVTKATNEWFSANRDVLDQNIGSIFTTIGSAIDDAADGLEAFLATFDPLGEKLSQISAVTGEMVSGLGDLFSAMGSKVDELLKPVTDFLALIGGGIQERVDEARAATGGMLDAATVDTTDGNGIRSDVFTPGYVDPTIGTDVLGSPAHPVAAAPAGGAPVGGQTPVIVANIHIGNETIRETVQTEVSTAMREAIDGTYGTVDR